MLSLTTFLVVCILSSILELSMCVYYGRLRTPLMTCVLLTRDGYNDLIVRITIISIFLSKSVVFEICC